MTEQNQEKRKETNIFIRVKFRETETMLEKRRGCIATILLIFPC